MNADKQSDAHTSALDLWVSGVNGQCKATDGVSPHAMDGAWLRRLVLARLAEAARTEVSSEAREQWQWDRVRSRLPLSRPLPARVAVNRPLWSLLASVGAGLLIVNATLQRTPAEQPGGLGEAAVMRGGLEPQVLHFATTQEADEWVREIETTFQQLGIRYEITALGVGKWKIVASLRSDNYSTSELREIFVPFGLIASEPNILVYVEGALN